MYSPASQNRLKVSYVTFFDPDREKKKKKALCFGQVFYLSSEQVADQ